MDFGKTMLAGLWTALFLLVVASESAFADSAAETTGRLEAAMAEQSFPGASVAVVRNGEIVYSAALGLADRDKRIPVTAQTRFAIGSMGKQFTATALMMLIDEGKLTVEDPIRKHLPEVPEQYDDVTVHQLLTHLSGVPRDFKKGHSLTGKKLYKAMKKSEPDFAAGSNFSYSNTGFILLGALVEQISGMTLDTFFQERIFDPLEMTRTICITPEKSVDDRATGYDGANAMAFLPVRFGAGHILSTADDLVLWDRGLAEGSVLSLELQETMWKPELPTASYKDAQQIDTRVGYGWFVKTLDDKRIVEHSGSLDGFFGTIVRHVDDGVTLIVLTNNERGDIAVLVKILEEEFATQLSTR